jgi:hypothetical protein
LGKEIHSRSFGVILAVLTVLRGLTGIAAGSMINLANQKQLLTGKAQKYRGNEMGVFMVFPRSLDKN